MGEDEEWISEFGNEFLDEFLAKDPPFFFLPEEQSNEYVMTNELLSSRLYSSPSINDIGNALNAIQHRSLPPQQLSTPMVPISERSSLGKVDKYTIKVKNGFSNDGYKWRKYGQKSIKNSPNPRSYYKCTNSICNAKKQVERSINEPNTYIITYEGFHFHFTYPFFLPNTTHKPNKKPKIHNQIAQDKAHFGSNQNFQIQEVSKIQSQVAKVTQENTTKNLEDELVLPFHRCLRGQGLLEDVVAPAMKHIPTNDGIYGASSSFSTITSSSGSSSKTTSPPLSPSSLCWSPNFNSIGFSDTSYDINWLL
ncbi:unnamed protein product [Cochlearia groenlandica]